MNNSELFELFANMLRSHDWYYDFSDDYSVYASGRDSLRSIMSMKQQLSTTEFAEAAEQLYRMYSK